MIKRGIGWLVLCGFSVVVACTSEPSKPGGDTQTNWLKACTQDSECGELSCECGVCSRPCSSSVDCAGAPVGVSCFAATSGETRAVCGENATGGMCLQPLFGAPAATTALEFADAFYAALCEHVSNCDCGTTAVENCSALSIDDAGTEGLITYALRLVEEGTVVYEPSTAEALLERLRDPSLPCGGIGAVLGVDSFGIASFGGVFLGTVEAGGPCEFTHRKDEWGVTPCKGDLRCLKGRDGTNTCVPIAGLGEPCPVVPNDVDSSCMLRQMPDAKGRFGSAYKSLSCIPDAPDAATGTCQQNAPSGSPCLFDEQCASGRCAQDASSTTASDVCHSLAADGSDCLSDVNCESFFCRNRVCVPRAGVGGACSASNHCESDNCDTTNGVLSATCIEPVTPAAVGAACSDDDGCTSDYCVTTTDGGTCAEPTCGPFL
jgi:hypothetical protein